MSIFSENKQFLFIHIEKNAGTSVIKTISKGLKIRWTKDFFYRGPFKGDSGVFLSRYEQHFGREKLDRWYKFCISRDPIDRMISWYNYNGYKKGSFNFWMNLFLHEKFDQINYIKYNDGTIGINQIIKIEELKSKWHIIEKKLNFKKNLLTKNKSKVIFEKKHITQRERKIIFDRFHNDYIFFNYEKK